MNITTDYLRNLPSCPFRGHAMRHPLAPGERYTMPNDDIVQIRADIEEAVRELWNETDPRDTAYWCRRIAKNILRCGFSLVQLEEGVHTRDLVLCVDFCCKYFSKMTGLVEKAHTLAQDPTDDRAAVLEFLRQVGDWIIPEADRRLDEHNPTRERAMILRSRE